MPRTGWLAIGAVGCALAFRLVLPATWPWLVVVLVASGATAACLAATRAHRGAAVAVGAVTIACRLLVGGLTAVPSPPPPQAPVAGPWTAEVVALGSTAGGQQRALLAVRAAAIPGATDGHAPWRVYGWLPRYPPLVPGDRIAFDDPLEPVRRDETEFAGYLDAIGAVATTRVRAMDLRAEGSGLLGVAEAVRRLADESLARVVPEPMAGLASAVLVGRRDRVAREVADAFTATGLSHVVAISGWNIALIGAVIGGLLAAAGLGRRQRTVAIVIVLGAFTLVAGGGASVVRAALMGGVSIAAREAGRPGTAAAALGLAVWLLLLADPAMATDIGFQLSVAATAGLLAWGSRLTDRLLGPDPRLARRWLAGSLGVSLAAQAATLPLVLFHFGRLSLVSPLANLVVAPIVAPAMLVGFLCLLVGLAVGIGAPVLLSAPFALLGWAVLGAMVAVAGAFAALPYASVELAPGPATLGAMVVAGLVLGAAWRAGRPPARREVPATPVPRQAPARSPSTRSIVVVVCVATLAIVVVGAGLLARVVYRDARLVVTALDVGQGDSILVEGPGGARLLLDGGPDPDRLLTVLDRHVPPWDRRIDLVILTHPHEDHVAGLAMLLARYRVAGIAENGMLGAGPGDMAFRERLASMGVVTTRLAAGDRLSVGGVRAEVVWPVRGEVPATAPSEGRRINDTSVVLDLRFGARRMLLTGDIEDDVDPRLLAAGIGGGQPLDVLKVAHHGSRTATSEAWLAALRPRVALISAGTGNPYGHPARPTLERLEAHGARVLRTDLDGDLEVSTDGRDLRVATSGGRPLRTATVAGIPVPAAGTPVAATVARGTFLCAIPLPAERLAALGPTEPPHPPRGRPRAADEPPPGRDMPRGGDPLLARLERSACYDRPDDHPLTAGGSRTAALLPARGRDPGAFRGHRGGGLVPGGRPDPRGPPGRPGGHRDGRPPP